MKVFSESDIQDFFLNKCSASNKKNAYVICGIPAAGKSTYVDIQIKTGAFPKNAFILNPDRVLRVMPEYQELLKKEGAKAAFSSYEMVSRKMAYDMFSVAVDRGFSIIIDMGCVRDEDQNNLLMLKERGYSISMTYIHCCPDEAVRRSKLRQRFTPVEMIYERYIALQDRLPFYRQAFDHFQTFDNSDLEKPFRPTDVADMLIGESNQWG